MNKFFIQINENRYGSYDFIIEIYNKEFLEEKTILGTKNNIDSLDKCFLMIKEFPLSEDSELTEVTFNRRTLSITLNKSEKTFVDNMNELVEDKPIQKFIVK